MALTFQSAGAARLPPRPSPGGRSKKIALLGSHSASLQWCPWDDPSWELWGHASSRSHYRRELDRYFDLHNEACWTKNGKGPAKYRDWLSRNTADIYMQEKREDIPGSVRYPKERILLEFGGIRRYFKNQVAWMIALAFSEGVTHLALFGINYSHLSEYGTQRGSAEYWLGRAEERGIHVFLPDECTLLAEPPGLYGYESHDEQGKRRPEYASNVLEVKTMTVADTIRPLMPGEVPKKVEPPAHLAAEIADEEARRPEWAKTNGRQEG